MTRDEIKHKILTVFNEAFEIENPGLDEDLTEIHGFDSIDAIELLVEIERFMGIKLSRDEKKQAMDIRTLNQIVDYVAALSRRQAQEVG